MPAVYIALEDEIDGLDTYVDGTALCEAERSLGRLAGELGVKPLMDFFGQAVADTGVFSDDELDEMEDQLPAAAWFEARQGLATVEGLERHLEDHPEDLAEAAAVRAELEQWSRVLRRAAERGVRWHLEVDF